MKIINLGFIEILRPIAKHKRCCLSQLAIHGFYEDQKLHLILWGQEALRKLKKQQLWFH